MNVGSTNTLYSDYFKLLIFTQKKLTKCHQLYECETDAERGSHSLIKYNDRPVCNLDKRVVHKSFLDLFIKKNVHYFFATKNKQKYYFACTTLTKWR